VPYPVPGDPVNKIALTIDDNTIYVTGFVKKGSCGHIQFWFRAIASKFVE